MPAISDGHVQWYESARPMYERLGRTVESIVTELLVTHHIDFLAVTSRAKGVNSFSRKLQQKAYTNPAADMTDLCGVRVVTYLDSDVARVVSLIRDVFDIDSANSIDKSASLDVDRVGYRSVHTVCSLGDARTALSEYGSFAGAVFEVQVRTALQHAWAQIEHDRNYKFGGILPSDLRRRLHLAAGSLELIDQEFDRIARDVDTYAKRVVAQAEAGELDEELNTTSVRALLALRASEHLRTAFSPLSDSGSQETLIEELREYGLSSLGDLDRLLTPQFFEARNAVPELDGFTNEYGLARDAMLFADIDRYFANAWHERWAFMVPPDVAFLSAKYTPEKIASVLAARGVEVVDSADVAELESE